MVNVFGDNRLMGDDTGGRVSTLWQICPSRSRTLKVSSKHYLMGDSLTNENNEDKKKWSWVRIAQLE